MDGEVTREEAAARWRLDLGGAAASSRQTWPGDVTAGMSEFEWFTLVTEILMPVRNELVLEFEETQQRDQPARESSGDSHGDDDRMIGQEEETGRPASTGSIRSSWPLRRPATGGSRRTWGRD